MGRHFLRRLWAMLMKEFIQMRRDRLTFAMMISIPIMQLLLFGFAINTNPKRLPTALFSFDNSSYSRAVVAALQNSALFRHYAPPVERRRARLSPAGGAGSVRGRDTDRFRARSVARRPPEHPRCRRRDRSGRHRECPGSAHTARDDSAAARDRRTHRRLVAARSGCRYHRPPALQPGWRYTAQHRSWPARCRTYPYDAHLHLAGRHARDRARHGSGKPCLQCLCGRSR